jgi:hypothetical protein
MPPPTNVSAATAVEFGPLPASVTQDVNDAGTTYTVWYRYTAQIGDGVIGFYAYGDASTYQVRTKVWTGSAAAPVAWLGYNAVSSLNDALQIPVEAGGIYYFELSSWNGNVSPAVLTLLAARAPALTPTVGQIGINTETDGYPCVFLDATTAAVQRFVYPFPNGEYGAALPTGHLCVEDKYADTVSVYHSGGTGALVATVVLGSASSSQPSIVVGSNRTNLFYLGNSQPASTSQLHTLTPTGTLSGVLWTVPVTPLQALAVNPANTILYYAAYASASPIYAYDLVGAAPLANLAAGLTDYLVMPDLFVLADGSILAAYVRNVTTNPACVVKRYSAAGATLNTYNFNFASTTTVRLACALDDPDSFWLKRHRTGGQVTYYHLRVSDGAELSSATGAEFNSGVSSYNFPLDGAVHYGNAASCPFWILEALDGNGGNGGGGGDEPPYVAPSYHLDARYIRRLRRAPHVAQEHTRVFYKRFELDLERGVGLPTGQGADPLIALRVSRDGGHTWSEPVEMHAGQIGAYSQRVIARRLGHARDAVFEVTVSDPVAWALVQAWLDVEPGTS